jgi:oligopeptide/dipeptide ABC transporter ATP-binding protein
MHSEPLPDDDGFLLRVTELEKVYSDRRGGSPIRAVDGVTFAIRAGESCGILGESGSGKSTLARLVLGLERPTQGVIEFDGRDVHHLSGADEVAFRRQIQIVFQDPVASLNRRKTVAQIVSAPLKIHHAGTKGSREARVRELLTLVGLSESHAGRYPGSLSGGQCQRVAIARALALSPRFLVLDEAVSALDVSIRAQILNLLRELEGALGLTSMFISHDLPIVRYMTHSVCVMFRGRIVEGGRTEHVFHRPRHPYTHELLRAVPEMSTVQAAQTSVKGPDSETMVQFGCPFVTRCPVGSEQELCRTVAPPTRELEEGHEIACHFPTAMSGRE